MMETRVVDVARVRALVKRAHIMPLKTRFRTKKVCYVSTRDVSIIVGNGTFQEGKVEDGVDERTYGSSENLYQVVFGA